jgi:hypothetical protein
MQDKLIKIFKNTNYEPFPNTIEANLADQFSAYALENIILEMIKQGTLVPPVNIGDDLWDIYRNKPRKWEVVYLGYNGREWHINVLWWKDKDNFKTMQVTYPFIWDNWFFSEEEAEQALKDGV